MSTYTYACVYIYIYIHMISYDHVILWYIMYVYTYIYILYIYNIYNIYIYIQNCTRDDAPHVYVHTTASVRRWLHTENIHLRGLSISMVAYAAGSIRNPTSWLKSIYVFLKIYWNIAVVSELLKAAQYGYGSKLGTPIIGWLILN